MQYRSIQIMHVHSILSDIHPQFIRAAIADSTFNSATGQPNGKGILVMIAAGEFGIFSLGSLA